MLGPAPSTSEPGVDRLLSSSEDAEDAFVYSSEGFAADESFECFDAECELARCE